NTEIVAQSATYPAEHLVIRVTHELPLSRQRGQVIHGIARLSGRVPLKVAHASHLGNNLVYIVHRDYFLTTLHDTVAEHFRDAVLDVTYNFVAISGVSEVPFHVNHIRAEHLIGIFLNMEYNAVY